MCLLVVTLVSVGCERLPWEPKTKPGKGTAGHSSQTPGPQSVGELSVPASELVAKVNQTPISTTDVGLVTLELKRFVQASQQEWKPLPTHEVPEALDLVDVMNNLVDSELKAQDLRAGGIDQRPELRRRWAYLQRGFYAQEWDRWQRERARPTEEAIRQFYEQNKAGFLDPERIRVRQIVTQTPGEAEAVRATAVGGADFAQLTRDFSVGAGKEQGGDVGWYLRALDRDRLRLIGTSPTEGVFFSQLEPVAFALEGGQISMPVKGPDGRYYIVKLEERKSARQHTELEVHDAISELLTLQNLQGQLDQLRAKAQTERFPDRLESVQQ